MLKKIDQQKCQFEHKKYTFKAIYVRRRFENKMKKITRGVWQLCFFSSYKHTSLKSKYFKFLMLYNWGDIKHTRKLSDLYLQTLSGFEFPKK